MDPRPGIHYVLCRVCDTVPARLVWCLIDKHGLLICYFDVNDACGRNIVKTGGHWSPIGCFSWSKFHTVCGYFLTIDMTCQLESRIGKILMATCLTLVTFWSVLMIGCSLVCKTDENSNLTQNTVYDLFCPCIQITQICTVRKYVQYIYIICSIIHLVIYIYIIIYVYNVEYMTTSGQISHILL